MKVLLDMNLSPEIAVSLSDMGYFAKHWSDIGDPKAPDELIMKYASDNGYTIVTHDLDFSTILAATQATSPSIIQIRIQDILSTDYVNSIEKTLVDYKQYLLQGAIVVVDPSKKRARVLPL